MRPVWLLYVSLIALAGCTGPARATDVSGPTPSPLIATRKLYISKCARCHKLYDPTKYSDAAWNGWMDKMSRKAKLTAEQKETLARYIETIRSGPTTNVAVPR